LIKVGEARTAAKAVRRLVEGLNDHATALSLQGMPGGKRLADGPWLVHPGRSPSALVYPRT
jgi:hypothetical protein